VILGTGQAGFAPLHDGDVLQMEEGVQGGHHLWLALRLRGFRQEGTTTRLSAQQLDAGPDVLPAQFAYQLDPDTDGYCRLTNLRFQLDAGGRDYHAFLGQPLQIVADVRDPTGSSGWAAASIVVAPTIRGL
jgi:hypothetical protein